MSDCCNDKACEIEALRDRQGRVLKTVLVINALMFGVEFTAGTLAGSVSLVADSLDMLGDALVYGFSIYVLTQGARMKALSAQIKGSVMGLFGLVALVQVVYAVATPHVPGYETIGVIGLLALVANGVCFALLWHHRSDDVNMSSVWLCSRNDLIANVSVLVAAMGVGLTASSWPDIVVGLALALLFMKSAVTVLGQARSEMRMAAPDYS